jgi:hypothetical protein
VFPTTEDDMDGKRKGFLVALVIGLISGPALALGVTHIFGADPAVAAPATTAAAPSTTGALAATTTTVGPEADLAAACGAEGAALVAAEDGGTLSDLQQAALDALRPICAAAGFNLAGASSADGVLVSAPSSSTTAPPAVAPTDPGSAQGYDDDAEYEDGNGQAEYEGHEDDEGEG